MGIITSLIRDNQEKKYRDTEQHLHLNEMVLQQLSGMQPTEADEKQAINDGYSSFEEKRRKITEAAVGNVTQLFEKNAGKEHKGAGGVIKHVLSGLAGLNPAPKDPNAGQPDPRAAGQPDRPPRSAEQTDAIMQQKRQKTQQEKLAAEQGITDIRTKGQIDAEAGRLALQARKAESERVRRNQILDENKDLYGKEEFAYLKTQSNDLGKLPTQRNPTEVEQTKADFAKEIAQERGIDVTQLSAQDRVMIDLLAKDSGDVKVLTQKNHQNGMPWKQAREKAINDAGTAVTNKENTTGDRAKIVHTNLGKALADRAAATAPSADHKAGLRAAAMWELMSGDKPAYGLSANNPDRKAYNDTRSALIAELGPQAVAKLRAGYKAGAGNLLQIMKTTGKVDILENAFQLDIENARQASAAVGRTPAAKANNWVQFLEVNLTDDPELAQFRIATQTAVNQYARIMVMGGQGSDTSREHAYGLLNSAMPSGAFNAALDQLNKEAGNMLTGSKQAAGNVDFSGGGGEDKPKTTGAPKPTGAGGNDTVQKLLDKYK